MMFDDLRRFRAELTLQACDKMSNPRQRIENGFSVSRSGINPATKSTLSFREWRRI
jgi:hypothetical protein